MKKIKLLEEEICKLYISGQSSIKIAKSLNLKCAATIFYILKRNNIRSRSIQETNRKYVFDENYFEIINTEQKAYFLGLLMSDGCNTNEGFSISLQEGDKEILEKFQKALNHTGKLKCTIPKKKHWKNMYSFNAYSCKISQDLSNLGIFPNKTHFADFPNIPPNLYRHFIRGVFDGDGCIHINLKGQYTFSIMGNILLLNKIEKIFNFLGINCTSGVKNNHKNIKQIFVSGNVNCKLLFKYLYENATLFIERKKFKMENIPLVRCINKYQKKVKIIEEEIVSNQLILN